jgi:hypothetical protein
LSSKARVRGLPLLKPEREICAGFLASPQHRERFPKSSDNRASQVLELIHSDFVGPLRTTSLNGSKYFVVFTNDFPENRGSIFDVVKMKPLPNSENSKHESKMKLEKVLASYTRIGEGNISQLILTDFISHMVLDNNSPLLRPRSKWSQ